MKKSFYLLSIIGVLFLTSCSSTKPAVTDLSVYTTENIYHISGLTLTNEANNDVIMFDSMDRMREYLEEVTAADANKANERLIAVGEYGLNLEIVTLKNIYYVHNLTVTDEYANESITFENSIQLADYISDVTHKDNFQ